MFEESKFTPECEDSLTRMDRISEQAVQHNGDTTLKDRYQTHRDRWLRLKRSLQALHLNLAQLPEKWKQYHTKYVPPSHLSDLSDVVHVSDCLVVHVSFIRTDH